ncbi:MAG: hypothetical protein O3A29_22715 [Planctomycetota bacterium]|nr:hypothetical protein [Planctomycetota bacterium]
MKRKSGSSGDSLDLLLDTICNTFGGILFISMLVVILVNAASQDVSSSLPTQVDHQRLVESRRQLSDMTIKLDSLRRAVRQTEQLRDRFTDKDGQAIIDDLAALKATTAALHESRDASLGLLAGTQELINNTARETERLREAIRTAQQDLAAAKRQLESEVSLRSRTSKLPRQKQTTRQQVPFFLKAGRLCSYAIVDSRGNLSRNEAEVRLQEEGGKKYAVPVGGSGLIVKPDGSNVDEVTRRLEPFDESKYFIAIVVWDDSFEEFQIIKDAAVRGNYEYQLIPMPRDEKIYMGESVDQQTVQ